MLQAYDPDISVPTYESVTRTGVWSRSLRAYQWKCDMLQVYDPDLLLTAYLWKCDTLQVYYPDLSLPTNENVTCYRRMIQISS